MNTKKILVRYRLKADRVTENERLSMPAFLDFQSQAKDRFEELPFSGKAEEIGAY